VRRLTKFVTIATALAAGVVIRDIAARTGVTAADVAAKRPGDEIIPKPTTVWDRGITIGARPSDIWPWLVQMGYGRAGFYVPEWVDRVVWHVTAANSEVLQPEYACIDVGDIIADGPRYLAYWRVEIVDPEHSLVYWTRRHPWRGAPVDPADTAALERREHDLLDGGVYAECSWGFYLDPQGPRCTRLLIRTRAVSSPGWLRRLPYGLIDAYLSHAELRTIKRLAEAGATSADSYPKPPDLEQHAAPSIALALDPIALKRQEEAVP
jgi:hypothetical protein